MLITNDTEETRTHLWKSFERQRTEFYDWGRRKSGIALARQWAPVIPAIKQVSTVREMEQAAHQVISMKPIRDLLLTIYPEVGIAFAIRTYNQIHGKSAIHRFHTKQEAELYEDNWTRLLQTYALTKVGLRIQQITQTTRNFVSEIISRALGEGWSIQRTVDNMQDEWTNLSRHRATMIARTEIVSASNFGSITGVRQTGIAVEKSWLATRDGRTRDTHATADGQTVPLNGKFLVGGYELDYPGDPNAPAEEIIFCRCSQVYKPL